MRYAEVELFPGPEGFHPADRQLVESGEITRIAIHHVNQLDDGTIVLLYELHGVESRTGDVLGDHEDVLAYSLSPATDADTVRGQSNSDPDSRTFHSHIHIDPNEKIKSIFELPQQHSLVIDTPIDCLPAGGIRVLVLGDQATITDAVGAFPADIGVELVATGSYHPEDQKLYARLTARQQEILRVAVDCGYYAVPREATHEDIADKLGVAPVTIGEHLRKIESRILSEILPG